MPHDTYQLQTVLYSHCRRNGVKYPTLPSSAFAQTTSWTGGAYHQISDNDGNYYWVDDGSNWATWGNWSNGVPGAKDIVNIDRQSSSVPTGSGHPIVQVTNAQSASSLTIGTNSNNGRGQLEIRSGGSLNVGNSISVGTSQGASGLLTVTSGATVTNDANLIVGEAGVGTLTLTNGSVVKSGGTTVIADQSGARGKITVDSNATLANDKDLIVGGSGNGTLLINNGGKVTNHHGVIADHTGSVSTASISGENSTWVSHADLIVGKAGDGSLILANGASVQSGGTIVIADQSGARGKITVDSNATLASDKDLVVGASGNGTLLINNGGIVSSHHGVIADHKGSLGAASVTGASSTWTSLGDLVVGRAGDGTLSLASGAAVQAGGTTLIGDQRGAIGSIDVDSNATLSSDQDLIVGGNGDGSLFIKNGSQVSNNHGVIADRQGSRGIVSVTGAGSTWSSLGDLSVGKAGDGTLTLANDAAVLAGGTTVIGEQRGASGSIDVGSNATLTSNNDLIVGGNGSGALLIDKGGKVSNNNGVIAGRQGSQGTVTVTGAGSTWASLGDLTVGNSADATLTLDRDGRASAGSNGTGVVYVANEHTASGTLNIGAADNNAASAISAGHLDADRIVFGLGKGTVNFNHTNSDYQFNAAFEGNGTLNHIAGETVLNGDSSHFLGLANVTGGDLVVNNRLAGEIHVGPSASLRIGSNNGATGEVLSDITNNGVVKFDRNNDYTYVQAISGDGSVEQIGSGRTILTGDNTYAGGTQVRNGTLQLGEGESGGSTGSIMGDINVALPGTFTFNRSNDYTFAGVISGDGGVHQRGTGRTELTGDSSVFNGHTLVDAGILAVNGKLGGSNDVMSDATLAGVGQVGSTTVHNGGSIAPGNSIGTLTVAGDLGLQGGSTYQAEVQSDGARDHLAVTGAAQLDDGSMINVIKRDPKRYDLDRRYVVLTADQGLTGRFTVMGDTLVSTFYDVVDHYDSNSVHLDVKQTRLFEEAAETDNQHAAAAAAQSLKGDAAPAVVPPTHNELFEAIAYLPDDAPARDAFDQISGEFHASMRSALIEDSRLVRDAVNNRLLSTEGTAGNDSNTDTGITPWMTTLGSGGDIKGGSDYATLHHSTTGLLGGVDIPVSDNTRVGVLAGYSNTDLKARARDSSSNNDNIHMGLYGATQFGQLNLRAGAAYTWSRVDAKRSVNFEGYNDRLKSKYDAGTVQVFGELGQRFDLGRASTLEPFANLTYVKVKTDAFKESGGAAALHAKRGTDDQTLSTLGLRANTHLKFDNGKNLTLFGSAGWQHAFGKNTPTDTFQFDGSDSFRIKGSALTRNSTVIGAGMETEVSKNLRLGVSYSGQLGSGTNEAKSLQLNASYSF